MTSTVPEVELYTRGSCHVLAIAFERLLGNGFVVALGGDAPREGCTSDAGAVTPLHIYALDENGDAWDVHGSRPVKSVLAELAARHPDAGRISIARVYSVAGLSPYIDSFDADDRPLHAFTEADVEEAMGCVERLLPEIGPSTIPGLR